MGKILNTYGGFTATDLKNRSSIPSQADITNGGNYIDCSSVDIPTEIRDIIGEGSNDLGTIYLSAKVNKWSGFGPREWYLSSGMFYDRPKSNPYDMSNFCGYNHNAPAPFWTYKPLNFTHDQGATAIDIRSYIRLGEVDWKASAGIIMGLRCDVLDEYSNVLGSQVIALDSYYLINQQNFAINLNVTSFNYDKNIIVAIYFSDNTDSKIASIPNLPDYGAVIHYRAYAVLGTNDLSYSVQVANPTWRLLKGACSVQQGTNGFIVNYEGIDTNYNGQGDVSVSLSLYTRLNGGVWMATGTIAEFMPGDIWGTSGTLPFSLTFGDVVDFELR